MWLREEELSGTECKGGEPSAHDQHTPERQQIGFVLYGAEQCEAVQHEDGTPKE